VVPSAEAIRLWMSAATHALESLAWTVMTARSVEATARGVVFRNGTVHRNTPDRRR
jgi:hypothetical protein